jgi:hypothetical protein
MTAAAVPNTCDRCGTPYDDGVRACLCLESDPPLARGATGSSAASSPRLYLVPPPSSLLPGCVEGAEAVDLAEVEHLLRDHAAGRISPVEVALPALPAGSWPAAEAVREDFALVRGLRLWAGDDRPVPYACEWAAARLERHKTTVWRALGQLVGAGVLLQCGELPPRGGGYGTRLYLPGGAR